jgi:hypothetical protein
MTDKRRFALVYRVLPGGVITFARKQRNNKAGTDTMYGLSRTIRVTSAGRRYLKQREAENG